MLEVVSRNCARELDPFDQNAQGSIQAVSIEGKKNLRIRYLREADRHSGQRMRQPMETLRCLGQIDFAH